MALIRKPIGIDNGKVVYIEEKENPIIGLIGMKRHGMSLARHRMDDLIYHKWGKKVITLTDRIIDCEDMKEFKGKK